MSHVTCHVSRVTSHMSHVTCHMSHLFIYFIFFFGQSCGAYRWRVCYQRGLPRLVYHGGRLPFAFEVIKRVFPGSGTTARMCTQSQ